MNHRALFLTFILLGSILALSPLSKLRIANETDSNSRDISHFPAIYSSGTTVQTGTFSLEELYEMEGKGLKPQVARKLEILMDSARIHGRANSIVYKKDPTLAVSGKGVLVGVVDVGFDFTHPAFLDAEGKSRIVAVWDQGIESGTPPKGFNYGHEIDDKQKITEAKHGSQDYHSHGSHVAGIIGGSAVEGLPYTGVAPGCEFIFVATPMEENQVIDAVRYVFQKAEELGKPALVNLSLGSSTGPHDGTTLTDIAYEELDSKGKVIVTAGGNSGGHRMHISKKLSSTDSLQTFIDVPWHLRQLDFWGEKGNDFKISFSLYDTAGTKLQSMGCINTQIDSLDTTVVLNEKDSLQITAFSDDSSSLNGKPNISFLITDITKNLNKTHRIAISVTGKGSIHGWNSSYSHFKSYNKEGFSDGDTVHTIIDGGGCSRGALTIGAMTSKNQYVNYHDTLKTGKSNEIVGEIAPFSAIGPTIDGRQKPNIVTPGNMIIAPYNSYNDWGDSSEITDTFTVNGRTYSYGKMSGTSMATPFAAGAVALMLEVNPNLNRTDIMKILKETSYEDNFTGTFVEGTYSRWGYGKFDVKAAVRKAEEMMPIVTAKQKKLFKLSTFVTPQKVRLQLRNIDASVEGVRLFSLRGQLLYSKKTECDVEEIIIDRNELAQRVLLYQVTTSRGNVNGKVRF